MSDSLENTLKLSLLVVAALYCVCMIFQKVRGIMRRRSYFEFMYCLTHGELDKARELFQYLVTWSPKTMASWSVFRVALLDLRLVADSLPVPYERLRDFFDGLVRVALEHAPKSPYSFLLAAGLASQRLPGSEECRNYLGQALALANRNLDVYMWAGEIQMMAGQYRESSRYFSTVQRVAKLNRSEHFVEQSNIALAQLHSATEASHKFDSSPAIKYWSKSADLETDDVERVTHCLMKANEYARCGNNTAALEVLYTAYSNCPEDIRTPALVVLLRPCVTTLLRQDAPDQADKIIERAQEIGVHGCSIEAARVAWHRGDKQKAKELALQALDEDDGTETFALRLALLHGEMGNDAQKLALLEQAFRKVDRRVASPASESHNISDITVNTLVFFPFEPNLMGLRGVTSELATAYEERGMYDDAVTVWRQALRRDEHNPVKMVRLAKALNLNGQREEALKYARQAEKRLVKLLEEAPYCPLLHLALGDVYTLDGDNAEAVLHYKLVTCEPHNQAARKVVESMVVEQEELLKTLAKYADSDTACAAVRLWTACLTRQIPNLADDPQDIAQAEKADNDSGNAKEAGAEEGSIQIVVDSEANGVAQISLRTVPASSAPQEASEGAAEGVTHEVVSSEVAERDSQVATDTASTKETADDKPAAGQTKGNALAISQVADDLLATSNADDDK